VTVGVPTRNRAERLPRAAESVLAQTYRDLELVISDNASNDATPEVSRAIAERDERVRCVRHPTNVGLTDNFNSILRGARGEFVMVLADDDWLEPTYVEHCVAAFDADPGLAVASGGARWHRDGVFEFAGAEFDLLGDDPARRVRRYFALVQDNVTIYALFRRAALERALPLKNSLAGDWLLCGRLAMLGRMRTVGSTWLNRSLAGRSASYARTVESLGLTAFEGRHPHLAIARLVYTDIARDSAVYAPLGPLRRRALGAYCAFAVLRSRPFNVIEDALRPYLGRPWMRRVDRALRPVARRLQR
jgi:glycosyltransferase involved in cell wall biosynthesis